MRWALLTIIISAFMPVPRSAADDSTITGGNLPTTPASGEKQSSVTPPQTGIADLCQKIMSGNAMAISYKFFDPSWHDTEWENSRDSALASCRSWNAAEQDSGKITNLSTSINNYGTLSTQIQDKLVAATIQRLGPARDQQDTQICFANSAADVASYLSGTRVSTFSAAVRGFYRLLVQSRADMNFQQAVDRYNSGNWNQYALAGILDGTVCANDQQGESLTYTSDDLTQMWGEYKSLQKQPYKRGQAPTMTALSLGRYLHRAAPQLDVQDFFNNLDITQYLDTELASWLSRKCKIKVPRGKLAHSSGTPSVALDVALNAGAIPVIAYDSSILSSDGGGHSSLVVAKATIQGKNYYLVRNSWGADCSVYDKAMVSRCKLGHIWLTQQEIDGATKSVDFIVPAAK